MESSFKSFIRYFTWINFIYTEIINDKSIIHQIFAIKRSLFTKVTYNIKKKNDPKKPTDWPNDIQSAQIITSLTQQQQKRKEI